MLPGVQGLACPVKPLHELLLQPATAEGSSTAAATAPVVVTTPDGASALELWTASRLETLYADSIKIKCPFFRRRASDILEGIDMMARFLVIRHKSILDLPLGCRIPSTTSVKPKNKHLSTEIIFSILSNDWKPSTHKGYYITGRLNQTIYRDDCFFDGPDPDMPVKGLAKYVKASKDLFDNDASCAELLELTIVDDRQIQARWKLKNCVLRLPWRPMLPTWTGTTAYHLDDESLIYHHAETWDVSVLEAFCRTISPELGNWIWEDTNINNRQHVLYQRSK